ncbi:MAG: FAD-dependent oxidoreductase [Deltaproteobacteria bacterium]|nr:FAD-dependent oxidoreductase [Deltaproteobacteria bacterium]
MKFSSLSELKEYRDFLRRNQNPSKRCLRICMTGCRAYGAMEVRDALIKEVERRGLNDRVEIRQTGCQGFCARAPVMVLEPDDVFYQQVMPDDVPEIVSQTLMQGKLVERLLYFDLRQGRPIPRAAEIPFYAGQVKNVLENCGRVDPLNMDHYILNNGYAALAKVLGEMTPEQVVDSVERSKLRGRGGAGFPTGRKWRLARSSPGSSKYLICNADEGDPGAFMDRAVLEGDPHSVLEGMLVGAYAIGAEKGYVYVRAEYPIAVEHVKAAVRQAEERGLLGKNILGSQLAFEVEVKEGAGAFVCGEETALMASIEGRRGMPRARPPFPAQSGLDGKPTNINNVETFANIRSIILKGVDWYFSIGTEESKGTKIFSLAGKVNNTGLVEVPIGISMRQVIFDIGGGIPKGRRFKAVQMGGPSGGCVPERYLDLPIDYGSLQSIGAIMGSGGMVVMDENNCMVEIARFFLSFTQSESCGKCAPCRLGTKEMLHILTRLTRGEGSERDLQILRDVGKVVRDTSLCGLGQTCPKPVLSTLQYFAEEYEAHIKEKRCPAAVCEALVTSPCRHTCPVGIDIPHYVALIAEGRYSEAAELIRDRNPFPAICGRICHHPCEVKCRRGELDDPVAIRSLKRFAADWYFQCEAEEPEPFSRTKPQKVAVIGAGPTGLTCAYFLARLGYPVTVFEALPVGGGMLSVAIPDFRLPKEVIQKEIEYIVSRGVEIRYNQPIGTQFSIDDILKEGYQAVFIAAGTQKSQRVGIPGEEEGVEGLLYGLSFLRDVKLGKRVSVGKRVAVVGGGNTALDASRTALRLGAEEVDVYYRRSRGEMQVTEVEYDEAVEEGVQIHFLVSPTRIVRDNGRVKGLECIRMELGEVDESGRRRPVPLAGTEFFVEADTVIPAVCQAPDLSFLPADSKLERTKWETLVVNANNLATNVPGIFAGGDFVTGPTYVIQAIAAGRRGAMAVDKYLRGDKTPVEMIDARAELLPETKPVELEEAPEERPRVKMPLLLAEERRRTFKEIECGFTEERAREESKRCLRCDLSR